MYESTARKPDGYVTSEGGIEHDTRMCVHCGYHWEYVQGSGRKRGWCLKCMGITCGHPGCDPCIPIEARLEHLEGKRTPYTETILQLVREGVLTI